MRNKMTEIEIETEKKIISVLFFKFQTLCLHCVLHIDLLSKLYKLSIVFHDTSGTVYRI